MRYNRRKALSIFGAATAATVLVSASPSRAGYLPGVAVRTEPDETGRIRAFAWVTSPIARISSRIFAVVDGALILEVSDFTTQLLDQTPGPPAQSNYALLSRDPVLLPGFGEYRIEWEVQDEEGLVGKGFDSFWYWRKPVLTIEATPTVLDADHRVVTVTGVARWRHPASQEEHILANHPVYVSGNSYLCPQQLVISDADGRFSAQLLHKTGGDVYAYTPENR